MKIGLMPLFGGETAEPEFVSTTAKQLENCGFHSVWAVDHILIPKVFDSPYPYAEDGSFPVDPKGLALEPFTLLTFMAATTTTLRLGTGICVLPQRNPAQTAKQAADLDVLSGGRLDFGIGTGWLAEEFQALGVPFERRGARTRDYIGVMKALWENEVSSFESEFYTLPECWQYPKPLQKPHPPLYFGGESVPALRRVAQFGHWFGVDLTPEQVPEKLATLRELCDRAGRDFDHIELAVSPYATPCDRDMLRRYEDLGVGQVIMAAFLPGKADLAGAIDQIAEDLIR